MHVYYFSTIHGIHFKKLKPNGRNTGRKIKLIKLKSILTSLNSMYWICSLSVRGGLHVGHPLGYIASDIYSRYKRLNGFNVLHPMGYDAYGLPAEQYAIQTGQHPAVTTEQNIRRYREQLDKIGFSYDWDREYAPANRIIITGHNGLSFKCSIIIMIPNKKKAVPIANLVKHLETRGTEGLQAHQSHPLIFRFRMENKI